GAKPTVTMTESPAASVRGPPPLTSVKSEQPETTFRMTAAVPELRIVNWLCRLPPDATSPKSSDGVDTVQAAPGAGSAPEPASVTGGSPGPSDSSHGELPTPLGR